MHVPYIIQLLAIWAVLAPMPIASRDSITGRALPQGPNEVISMSGDRTGIVMIRETGETHIAIVDSADYPLVANYRWVAGVSTEAHFRNTTYARAMVRGADGKRHEVTVHGLLAGGPGIIVDHEDGNGLNNTRANLRQTDNSGNAFNRGKNSNNTSGFKGVIYRRDRDAYRAKIGLDYKRINLGQYATAEAAARAYDRAAIKHHGEFARLNFPRSNYEEAA